MFSIVNKSGDTVAYLYQNMILDLSRSTVIGLVLGNCVFGKDKGPAGKFFKDIFRKKNGKIIARIGEDVSVLMHTPPKVDQLLAQAWKMLAHVQDHTCVWVDEKDKWTKQLFVSYLAADGSQVEEEEPAEYL